MTKSIEKQQAATAAATIAQRVGSDTSAAAAVPLNAFCKFANATAAAVAHAAAAAAARPYRRTGSALQKRVRARVSLHFVWLGTLAAAGCGGAARAVAAMSVAFANRAARTGTLATQR